jgi:hypothetical protein
MILIARAAKLSLMTGLTGVKPVTKLGLMPWKMDVLNGLSITGRIDYPSERREAANSAASFFAFNIKIWNIKNILIIRICAHVCSHR